MNTALLIAARDVREKGRLFLIAAVLACMPFLATLLPTSRGHHAEVIATLGGFIGLVVGLGLATGLGITTIGSDLSSGRLSYWFSKPIHAGSLWAGRALGALFSSFACFAIIAVPAALAADSAIVFRYGGGWKLPLALIAAMAALFLAGHTVSTMLRSRSLVLGVDLAGAIVTTGLLSIIMRPLLFTPVLEFMLVGLAIAIMIVLSVAPYWQLANGRTDPRRSHAALSRAIWAGVAVVLILAGSLVWWLSSGKPQDFDRVLSIKQTPAGNAVFVSGSGPFRRGLDHTFALSPATGDSDRLDVAHSGIALSRDSRFAAWIEPGLFRWSRGTLVVRDLSKNEDSTIDIELPLFADISFSDDGARLAVRNGGTIAVHDRASGKLLAAMPVEARLRHSFWFVSPDVLRVVSHKPAGRTAVPLEIVELDVRTKTRTVTGSSMIQPRFDAVSVSADGSRMLLRASRLIVDGRTGATIATLPEGADCFWCSTMLSDGRVVTSRRGEKSNRVTIFSREGVLQREIVLPVRASAIVGERTDGKLIFLGFSMGGAYRNMFVVDGNRGTIERTLHDVRGPAPSWSPDPRLTVYDAKAKLAAVGANGKLTYWN